MHAPTAQTNEAQPFARLGAASIGAKQVVLVPGGMVPMFTLDLPSKLRGQAREQVARRRLADRLGLPAAEIAMRPFSPHGGSNEAWTQVLTAEKTWLEGLRDLPGRAVLPDYLSLPTSADLWTVQRAEEAFDANISPLMVRLGPADGFSAQPALTLAAMRRALDSGPKPKAILLLGELPDTLFDLADSHHIPILRNIREAQQHDLTPPQILAHDELACDLRSNPMAARAGLARSLLPWRWTALAACLAAGIWSAGQYILLERSKTQTRDITRQTHALVQEVFTNGGPILDARLQVSRALGAMQNAQGAPVGDMDPLNLMHDVARVLTAAQVQPESLSFRAAEGLTLNARLPDFSAADQLAAALRAEGLTVALRDSRAQEGASGVRVEFAISHLPQDRQTGGTP